MRHRNAFRKLSRSPAHRRALYRNLATALVLKEQIITTVPKAKELKRIADKLITLGKKDTLHARRQAMRYLMTVNREARSGDARAKGKQTAVHRLFGELAPRYVDRHGGYTRVLRIGKRDGDRAELAVIQFVEAGVITKTKREKRTRRVVKRPVAEGKEPGGETFS